MFRLRTIALLATLLTGVCHAQFFSEGGFESTGFGPAGFGGQTPSYVTTSAKSSVETYKKGTPFYIAMQADVQQGWHAYFRNPGTIGMPLTAELQAPAGFKVSGPYWNMPHRAEGAVGVSYSYEAPVLVWEVTAGEDAPQQAQFSITSTIQVCCDTGCAEPDTQTVTVDLAEGEGQAKADWGNLQEQVEVLGDTPATVSATQTSDAVTLKFKAPAAVESAYFFSEDNSISPTARQTLTQVGENEHTLTLPRNDNSDSMYPVQDEALVGKPLTSLSGILTFGDKHTVVSNLTFAEEATTPAPATAGGTTETTATPATPAQPGTTCACGLPDGFWGIAGSLFLGGLILNLMPCVFPVIGLKVMSFVELGGGSRGKIFLHSLTFVLGILISFWILSIILIDISNIETMAQTPWTEWHNIILNDSGSETRNWAIWMQNSWVVYGTVLLLLILGLSMYGVFEIGVGATAAGQDLQQRKGLSGSFFQGLFVTLVATPCSAPFLGATMPVAMAMPGIWMTAALTFMALGLASPYIVMGLFPVLVQWLPRPGEWMESLKQGLSFLLFAAAAWMVDVYLATLPESAAYNSLWILISLVVICSAFWVYGRWCPIYRSKRTRLIGLLFALALLAVGVWGSMPPSADTATPAAGEQAKPADTHTWVEWSEEAMQDELEAGNPVYVDFTAKWCATCQVNKKTAYSEKVYDVFHKNGVVLMRADKTRPNPAIDAAMRKVNRSSVPTNVLYVPDKEPAVTSELLTPGYMLDFLKKHLED